MTKETKVVVNHPSSYKGRVGTKPATECIETYLRRVYELFHGGKVGKDVVFLLEFFFFYKVGSCNNKPDSAIQAVFAISDFLTHAKTPPWKWASSFLYEYLTDMHIKKLAPNTIRGRHHYIRDFCVAILSDRDIANKLEKRHPGASFQQITNAASRALVRGFGKKKKLLANPTPNEVQQVMNNLESEIIEVIETGAPTPWVRLRDRAVVAMLYAYGLRLSELQNADVTHFDFDPECPEYGDFGILHVIGKGDKDRHLPVLVDWIYPVLKSPIGDP